MWGPLNTSFTAACLGAMCFLMDVIYLFFREDIFIFQGKDYTGALQSVSIKRDNSGQYGDWYLETVND